MSTRFLIQSIQHTINFHQFILPADECGDTAIRLVDFWNWYYPNADLYSFNLITQNNEESLIKLFKQYEDTAVPIGSVEFVLAWFKSKGINNVKPLNIPEELWRFCDRKILVGSIKDLNGRYYIKDTDIIKSDNNGAVDLPKEANQIEDKKWFISEWLNDVESEWRAFVYNGAVQDVRCYSGDFRKTPDYNYIDEVVKSYDNPVYTLDVMVNSNKTEILELHDFFSCGLYGFNDTLLPLMWKRSINEVIKRYSK